MTLIEIRSPVEFEHFAEDMQAMFSGDASGTGLKYLYQRWGRVLADESYYVDQEERDLIADHADELRKIIGLNRPLIELGCGPSDKGVFLARAFNAAAYIPVDFWKENAVIAASFAAGIPAYPLRLDFMRTAFDWRAFERPVVVMLGSTISNLVADSRHVSAEDALRGVLQKIIDVAGPDGDVIITYDTSQEAQDTYNTPEHIAFRKSLFDLMNIHLPDTHLDQQNFSAPAVWDGEHNLLSHLIVSDNDQSIRLSGKRINLQPGQTFIEGKSYKYPEVLFDAVSHSLELGTGFKANAGHMMLQHLRPI